MKNKTITIVGLGMLGASIAEGLKAVDFCKTVQALVRRQETADKAVKLELVDTAGTDNAALLAKSDLTIFCTPIPVTEKLIAENINFFKKHSILTDIASTKSRLVSSCLNTLKSRPDLRFIGGHPMAGSEKSGMDFRKVDMYKGANVFLTPEEDDCTDAIRTISDLWNALGAKVTLVDKCKHDEVVAYASQALHVVASGAARAVLDNEDGRLCAVASAGGFRDLTRIASSNPTMWREILENNPDGNILALSQIIAELNYALNLMKANDWDGIETFFAHGKQLKDDYLEKKAAAKL